MSIRIAALVITLIAALAALPARAGDTAEAEVLGFSPDAGLFAFEEYGVQDGSGFPYANIYVIDTETDSWVPGTPIRVRREDERATLAQARAEARSSLHKQFGDIFDASGAITLAHSPLGEIEANPTRLAFAPTLPAIPLGDPEVRYEALLDIYYAEAQTDDCVTVIGDRPMGFRLTVEREGGGSVVLSEDDTIPRSRGCAITYRLSRVVVPGYPPETVAILISVFSPGFEGPQRRFIAVTGQLPG